MRSRRIEWGGSDPAALAAEVRGEVPEPAGIAADVAGLVESVRVGGDARLLELVERLDGARPKRIEVPAERRRELAATVPEQLQEALRTAADNIAAVARAQEAAAPIRVEPGQGQTVTVSEVAVGSAAIYVPGGRAPYPSTALMGVIAARTAGVGRVVVATPPGPEGEPAAATLAACELAGADTVYAIGGAQAIAALAYGTETVGAVDVIAGPGGPWVQEAKLAVSRSVGIDGYAGPSELVVVVDDSPELGWIALDLCAQAEHGGDGLLVAISPVPDVLDRLAAEVESLAAGEERQGAPSLQLVAAPDAAASVALADALAPEHLQLCCRDPEPLAATITRAGCVFVGPYAATAFGDYAAGSNHVLPTGGTGRFSGPLGPGTFRRRISSVEMSPKAAVELGEVVDAIARAEGFPLHGSSALARAAARDPHGRRED
jgi:histidinol dehydrogenase